MSDSLDTRIAEIRICAEGTAEATGVLLSVALCKLRQHDMVSTGDEGTPDCGFGRFSVEQSTNFQPGPPKPSESKRWGSRTVAKQLGVVIQVHDCSLSEPHGRRAGRHLLRGLLKDSCTPEP